MAKDARKGREIKRKFLIKDLPNTENMPFDDITQGYSKNSVAGGYIYRLKQAIHFDGYIPTYKNFSQTIKENISMSRMEYEINFNEEDFHVLWYLCLEQYLHKYRYTIKETEDYKIFLDIFKNELFGLSMAEVVFKNEDVCEKYLKEDWIGEEVTFDVNYNNYILAKQIKTT